MPRSSSQAFVWILFALAAPALHAASLIGDVAPSSASFNPSLGQTVHVEWSQNEPGTVSVLAVDRDGYAVRKLISSTPMAAGTHRIGWDGRDDNGIIVADEAYSWKIDVVAGTGRTTYFPASVPDHVAVRPTYYDRRSGILAYQLPTASRVHIQAGTAKTTPSGAQGPVLKTIANRAPRTAGSVIEQWGGLDESGTTYVPDLPDFVMSIAATPLPENAVITTGNRTRNFASDATRKRGKSLFTLPAGNHHHHRGLEVLDDTAPTMRVSVENGTYAASDKRWRVRGPNLTFRIALEGPSASAFARHPGLVHVFVDGKLAKKLPAASARRSLTIPLPPSDKPQLIAVNWVSEFGPVAAETVQVGPAGTKLVAERRPR